MNAQHAKELHQRNFHSQPGDEIPTVYSEIEELRKENERLRLDVAKTVLAWYGSNGTSPLNLWDGLKQIGITVEMAKQTEAL